MAEWQFDIQSVEEMTLNEPTWIIPGLVPSGGLTIVDGKPKSGKSNFVLGLAMSVAQGTPFAGDDRFSMGSFVDCPSPTLWVGTDSRWDCELYERAKLYPQANRGNLRVLDGRTAGLCFPAGNGPVLDQVLEGWHILIDRCRSEGYVLVVVDHLLKVAGARGVNNDVDIAPIIQILDRFAYSGIVPILVHHQSVHGNGGNGMGHTLIHAAKRSGISLVKRGRQGSQTVYVETNENPKMMLSLEPFTGAPPVVLDFAEAKVVGDGEAKRKREPKTDIALVRTRAILDGPDDCRLNQTKAGKHLEALGDSVMATAKDGRSVVKGLIAKDLLQADDQGRLRPGARWESGIGGGGGGGTLP
jgi:hypothetical protein